MAKSVKTFDHTADVGLASRADSLAELFEAMAEGLADLICPREQVQGCECVSIEMAGDSVENLLVDWLTKVSDVIQVDHLLLSSVRVDEISPAGLSATLQCQRFDPKRHELATEVKAVTYHMLEVSQDGPEWTARVILDI